MNNKTTTNSANNNIKPAVPSEDLPLTEVVSETTVLKRRARSADIASSVDRQKPAEPGSTAWVAAISFLKRTKFR